ncbi:MAG: radical SAM protein [Candidatus Electrothrix sp. YB6]
MTIPHCENSKKPCEQSMCIDSLILLAAPQVNSRKRFGEPDKVAPAMLPDEAVAWIGELIKGGKEIHGLNICGPGDALAAPDILLAVLTLLQERYPDLPVKVTTIGLGAAQLADALAEKGVVRIDLQVEAVTADVAQKVYAWIRPGKKTVPLPAATELLVGEQEEAIRAFCAAGLEVNILTTVYPGLNEAHINAVAEKAAGLGAITMTLIPFRPVSEEENLSACDTGMLAAAAEAAAPHLKVLEYGERYLTPPSGGDFKNSAALLPKPSKERPNVAVASSNGMDVDLHLGQAGKMLIYGPRQDGLACLLESRNTPAAGSGTSRWQALADECLSDCFALLAANAGENPQKVLAEQGIKVLLTEENIEGTVDVLYGGGKKKKCKK